MLTVYDLNKEQLEQLKQDYILQLEDSGEYEDIILDDSDRIISDEFIIDYYYGVMFTEEDFY